MRTTTRNPLLLMACGLILVACGGSEPPGGEATSGGGEGTPAPVAESADLDSLLASADVKRGETLYFQCRACHTLNEGGQHKVGPNLWGLFGKTAGTAPGFTYSDALKNSGIVWTPETIDQWLAQPSDFLPGNMMVFVGVKKPKDRANLIVFLQQNTGASTD